MKWERYAAAIEFITIRKAEVKFYFSSPKSWLRPSPQKLLSFVKIGCSATPVSWNIYTYTKWINENDNNINRGKNIKSYFKIRK